MLNQLEVAVILAELGDLNTVCSTVHTLVPSILGVHKHLELVSFWRHLVQSDAGSAGIFS
eukprot:7693684-Pyramimonas_sp.AAC.1